MKPAELTLLDQNERQVPRTVLWLLVILAVALLLRLPLVAFPGHGYDLGFFASWTGAVHENGLDEALEATPPVDYPAFPVLLWPIAELYGPFIEGSAETDEILSRLVKLPGVIGDLLVIGALFLLTRSLAGRARDLEWASRVTERLPFPGDVPLADKAALAVALVFALNPAVIYGSAYWGQIDSLITLAMLGALAAVMARRPGLAGMALAAGFALKPQTIIIAPVMVLATLQRSGPRGVAWSILGAGAGLALALGYFVLSGGGDEIWETYVRISGYQDRLSYNAWNIWWPAEVGENPQPSDPALHLAGVEVSFRVLGMVALIPAAVVLLLFQNRHRERHDLLVAGAFTIISFFMLATSIHERYLIYSLGLLAPLAILDRRWAAMYGALTVTVLLNMSASLPPFGSWADIANSEAFSMAMTALNLGLYGGFAGLMMMPGERAKRSVDERVPNRVCYAPATIPE